MERLLEAGVIGIILGVVTLTLGRLVSSEVIAKIGAALDIISIGMLLVYIVLDGGV